MDKEEITKKIELHELWLKRKGEEGQLADFSDEYIEYYDFSGRNLAYAIFENTTLIGCTFKETKLQKASFCKAGFYKGEFFNAELCQASFEKATLSVVSFDKSYMMMSHFWEALIIGCLFTDTELQNSDFREAYIEGTRFDKVNLYGTYFTAANLRNTIFDEEEEIRLGKILTEPMIGWKKCKNNVYVKLEIPRGAIVFSINNTKCRTNTAKVLEVVGADRGISIFKHMSYYKGDEFNIYDFNTQYNVECGEGIHFFRTREEAEAYGLL